MNENSLSYTGDSIRVPAPEQRADATTDVLSEDMLDERDYFAYEPAKQETYRGSN